MATVNLNFLNPENTARKKPGFKMKSPCIAISGGTIRFNKLAADALSLNELTKIEFCNVQDEPTKWFVYKSIKGFELKQFAKMVPDGYVIHSSALSEKINTSMGLKDGQGKTKFEVAAHSVKLNGFILWPMTVVDVREKSIKPKTIES